MSNQFFYDSLLIRIESWRKILNDFNSINYFFGIGVGGSGLAVDGLYAKAYLDGGIILLVLIILILKRIFYIDQSIGVILFIFSTTIDVFTSSKMMYAFYIATTFIKNKQDQLRKLKILDINNKILIK